MAHPTKLPEIPEPFSRFMIGFHMLLFFFSLYQISRDEVFYGQLAKVAIIGVIIWSLVYLYREHLVFELDVYEYEHNYPPSAEIMRTRLNHLYLLYAGTVAIYIASIVVVYRFGL